MYYHEFGVDVEPFELFQALREREKGCFILESAQGPKKFVENSFIGFAPKRSIISSGGEVLLDGLRVNEDALKVIRNVLHLDRHRVQNLKFSGGLVGYFGYDFIRQVENLPDGPPGEDPGFPDIVLNLYLDGVIYDHQAKNLAYVSLAEDRFSHVETVARQVAAGELPRGSETFSSAEMTSDMDQPSYIDAVKEAKEAIAEGEIFQVVVSRHLETRFEGSLLPLYGQLRKLNPSPYMYYLDLETPEGLVTIAGASPEQLVSVNPFGEVSTYPIAGTRPLGETEEETQRLGEEMLADPKELAEHEMLVDLARNDLGRVCDFGSVEVAEHRSVERFSHVQHIVSRVTGQLREDRDALDALSAVFPAGTVSGAPKVRAMELIDKLEQNGRGPYAGVVGYLSLNGSMDTAITIRTFTARDDRLYVRVGAGIVYDSDPESEWTETEHKVKALRKALELGQS